MLKDNSVMSHWVFLDLLKVAGRTVEKLGKFGIFIEDLSLPCNMFESSELPKTGVTTIKAICKIISAHWIDFQEVQDGGGHFQMHQTWMPGVTIMSAIRAGTFDSKQSISYMLTNLTLQTISAICNKGCWIR